VKKEEKILVKSYLKMCCVENESGSNKVILKLCCVNIMKVKAIFMQ